MQKNAPTGTSYDLSTKPGAAATSKHLVGFANRDFQHAARHAEGHAYLLIGVEPGNLVGVSEWDSADVQKWLERFAGSDIRYDLHYVETGGKKVMFLTVDPPRPGDPLFCMQAQSAEPGGKTLSEGTIYVRLNGRTEVAKAADITRLTERASGGPAELELELKLDGSALVPLPAEALDEAAKRRWLNQEEHELLDSLPPKSGGGFPGVSLVTAGLLDCRSPEEFRLEVASYLANAEQHWLGIVTSEHIESVGSTFFATVVNLGADNYEDVVIELTLPFPESWVYVKPDDTRRFRPRKPARFNSGILAPDFEIASRAVMPISARPKVERADDKHALVRYPPMHVRPFTSHQTDELSLLVIHDLTGKTVPIQWRITASNRSGQVSGTAGLAVPGRAPTEDEQAAQEAR